MIVAMVRRGALCALIGLVLSGLAGVAGASAEGLSPWWGASGSERPTGLRAGTARDAIAVLTVKASAGEFALIGPQFNVRLFAWNAADALVQAGLEELYPGSSVEVTGGPGKAGASEPYTITFPGQRFCPVGVSYACVQAPIGSGEYPEYYEKEPGVFGVPLSGGSGGASSAIVVERAAGVADADGQIVVDAQNRGDASTSGTTTISDHLPQGLKAVAIEGHAGAAAGGKTDRGPVLCVVKTLTCTFSGALPPFEELEVSISVEVQPGAVAGGANTASVSGGGATRVVTLSRPVRLGGDERFGIEDYELIPEESGGAPDTQAGSHPFQVTNIDTLDTTTSDQDAYPRAVGTAKDIVGELPTGFIGNPTPFAQCTDQQFTTQLPSKLTNGQDVNECPAQSAVGVATVTFTEPQSIGFETTSAPIFNMVPLPGEPARFAFKVEGIIPVYLDASVRTGSDYGVTIASHNLTQIDSLLSAKLTFWGVPGEASHDHQRGWECLEEFGNCAVSSAASPPPFLVMPTSCEAPFVSTGRADSWGSSARAAEQAEPLSYDLEGPSGEALSLDGCNHLPFSPSIKVSPDVPNASTATGLTVDVHVPQTAALDPEGLAESSVRDLSVTLPAGVGLNPSGADGLQSCPLLSGSAPGQEAQEERHELVGVNLESRQQANCPNASKIATVKVKTPLLPNALEGFVYLATPAPNGEPGLNPFDSLLALYFVAEDPVSGTLIKLPLKVTPNEATGQLTATQAIPELPFEDAELHFFGGERAPLTTPTRCGAYTTSATFTPWSGNEPANPLSTFDVELGPDESSCPGQGLAFAPTLTGGTTNINAAAFSPLTTTITREDGQQNISAVKLRMPSGLSGILSHVALCGEAQANAGTCGAESLIGETIVSVGLGSDPYSVTGGKVYITGPYHGAPFGLSIVNPAVAGPFDLGLVIVRAKVEVDPRTAQLTITTNSEAEGDAIPHIIDGIPLQIKHVNVTIDRPGFTFNPTDCDPQQITGTISSDEGASAPVAVPFQVTNCASLKFAPKFAVSTNGKTSRAGGASLTAKLSEPSEAQGSQANIARVKVDLPKQLPSRLSTLQKACTNAQFETNPSNCPSASKIGFAKVTTPLLPVPLEGPAIFVSHGGEAFPSLTMVLQGYGVTVDLVGTTFISKTGITSTTFKTVPDVPFTAFTLMLPEGKYSALAANGNLCKSKLAMPTEFLAQNGAEIRESTVIAVSGCKKAKRSTKKHKRRKSKRS